MGDPDWPDRLGQGHTFPGPDPPLLAPASGRDRSVRPGGETEELPGAPVWSRPTGHLYDPACAASFPHRGSDLKHAGGVPGTYTPSVRAGREVDIPCERTLTEIRVWDANSVPSLGPNMENIRGDGHRNVSIWMQPRQIGRQYKLFVITEFFSHASPLPLDVRLSAGWNGVSLRSAANSDLTRIAAFRGPNLVTSSSGAARRTAGWWRAFWCREA